MSAKVVTPPRIISATPSRVPERTKSSVTFFASAGKIYLRSQSSSVTSSRSPRRSVIAACVCPLMNPGSTSLPFALMLCAPEYFDSMATRGPTATIASPCTAIAPSSMTRRSESIVTIVPPVTSRSTFFFAADCARAQHGEKPKLNIKAHADTIPFFILLIRIVFIFLSRLSQVGGIKRFRKQVAYSNGFGFAFQVCQNHRHIAAEFPNQLAACSAGWRERVRISDDGDGVEAALALAHGFENRNAFRADGQAIGRVLHVAAAKNSAGRGAHGGADAKIRVRRVRIFARLLRCSNQKLMFTHAMASAILGITALSSAMNCPLTRSAVSSTSMWLSGWSRIPAAALVTQEIPSTRIPL